MTGAGIFGTIDAVTEAGDRNARPCAFPSHSLRRARDRRSPPPSSSRPRRHRRARDPTARRLLQRSPHADWPRCRSQPARRKMRHWSRARHAGSDRGRSAARHRRSAFCRSASTADWRRGRAPDRPATGSCPSRMRECAATIIGTCEVSRTALRKVASRELSAVSGSNADSAEAAVRSTSIGCADLIARMMSRTGSRQLARRLEFGIETRRAAACSAIRR